MSEISGRSYNDGVEAAARSHERVVEELRNDPASYKHGKILRSAKRASDFHERSAAAIRALQTPLPPSSHVVPLREASRQEAVRLVERAGLEMEGEYDLLIEDLTETMLRFASVEPSSETATPEAVYFRFVRGDAFGQVEDRLRIRKWDTKPFDGAIEYRAALATTEGSEA